MGVASVVSSSSPAAAVSELPLPLAPSAVRTRAAVVVDREREALATPSGS